MPEEVYCQQKRNYHLWQRKPSRCLCEWADVNWDEFNARSQYSPCTFRELDDLKALQASFLRRYLEIWASMQEPELPELEAEIEEAGLELRCLKLAPTREFRGRIDRVQLSMASSEFSRSARGLPLVLVAGEEEAE